MKSPFEAMIASVQAANPEFVEILMGSPPPDLSGIAERSLGQDSPDEPPVVARSLAAAVDALPDPVTVKQIAALVGVHEKTIRRHIKERKTLRGKRLIPSGSSRFLVRKDWLMEFLKERGLL